MKVIVAENETQLNDALSVRKDVFVNEQNVPLEEEVDQYDTLDAATHFVVYSNDKTPIGAGRLRTIDGSGKIERICILKNFRKTGAGKLLMEEILRFAKKKRIKKSKIKCPDLRHTFL